MLKVMIVDDEVLARIGVKSLIAWGENDFELIGECENGKSAYKMAMALQPDIIITDVKMPMMNGIELIKALKAEGHRSKFIMLSSYDEFGLVKEAMKLGAEDYILKLQMEPEELLKVLNDVRNIIIMEEKFNDQKAQMEASVKKDFTVLKDQFIKDLMYGNINTEEAIAEQLEMYNIILPPQNLLCLVVQVDKEAHTMALKDEMFRATLTNIIGESIRNYGKGQVVFCQPDIYSMVCSLNSYEHPDELHKSLEHMTVAMKTFIKNSMNVTISIGVSKIYRGFKFIRQAYLEAMEAMRCSFSYPEGSVILFEDIEHQGGDYADEVLDQRVNELALALRVKSAVDVEEAFYSFIESLKKAQNLSEKYLIGNSHIVIFIMNDFIKRNNLSAYTIWGKDESHYFQLANLKVMNDYIEWVDKIRKNVMAVLMEKSANSTIILRAKQFVHSHIKENITLTAISEYLGLSSSYFSRMFSKETGQKFIDYVTEEKIQLAKELIQSSNKKIYEVAEVIGYENVYYFSRVFKKTTGMSPLEFRSGRSEEAKAIRSK